MTIRSFTFAFAAVAILFGASSAHAHDGHRTAIAGSVEAVGFADSVRVACGGEHATIQSQTYPDHELMAGIVGTNEQVPVPIDYRAPIILAPKLGSVPLTRDAALGVAVNGVPIYDYTVGGEMSLADLAHHQARHDTIQTRQLDICGGHSGRGDDYHHHAKPTCMIVKMANAGDDAIIGWAFDGFPIYGDNNPDGTPINKDDLDVCNGQADATFGYRYHTSLDAPYIVQCLMGEVPDFDRLPRVRPLKAVKGRGTPPGHLSCGGVENLIFTEHQSSQRSMDYRYNGADYYIRYTLSARPDCYTFEIRTVTNRGKVHSGEYCR